MEIRNDYAYLLLQSTHRMIMRYDANIGHRFVANLQARIPSPHGAYYVKTNSEGFRSDAEFTSVRGERPRILFLGDSMTAGDGCVNSERFSELVGAELDAEVFNYALSGTGTDQQVLVFENFACTVDADLVVFCVYVENIQRVQLSHRVSIDRTTSQRVLVPKPYFTLEEDGLALHNVPVPLDRAPTDNDHDVGLFVDREATRGGAVHRLREIYVRSPRLVKMGKQVREHFPWLWSMALGTSGFQPFKEYESDETPAWRLMRALLQRFLDAASPTPVLIVPVPDYRYFFSGVDPIYQQRYESLAAPEDGVHVVDLTTALVGLDYEERKKLVFEQDRHFTPLGHRRVASILAEAIRARSLVPETHTKPQGPVMVAAPGLGATYVLGLSCFYHNSAACLVKDGELVAAAEEERFSRVKNDRRFPGYAANYCLEQGGIDTGDLSAVVYYEDPSLTFERLLHTQVHTGAKGEEAWVRILPNWVRHRLHVPQVIRAHLNYDGLLLRESHHRSHTASAFYPSPFDSAAILTVDGVGEWATASIGIGNGAEIRLLKEMHFPNSLGLLYSAFTQFTGFKVNEGEYKMMGLAPYGTPRYAGRILDKVVDLKEDGSVELNLELFGFLTEPSMTNECFASLFGGPARAPEARITRRETDIAASIQAVTEEAILRMARHVHELTGEANLCLAGGVALNCVANGRLLREGPFDNLWIQPAAGDSGGALGSALDAYYTYFGKPRTLSGSGRSPQQGSYLGPGFSNDEIGAFLETHGYPATRLAPEDRADRLAAILDEGNVLGHFWGRAEFGPRALGARSILGDARNRDMQVNLNLKIKYRESFRPFAPTVLAEKVEEYFELDRESPYMLLVAQVQAHRHLDSQSRQEGDVEDMLHVVKQARSDVPAITHVDYSARIQTITREDGPEYYDLIQRFDSRTGCATIVNTSFNVRGEPIVCTPYDAYRCFMRTEMDYLALGNFLLCKQDQPPWPEEKGHVEKYPQGATPLEEDALARGLRQLFRNRFLPIAKHLCDCGEGRISDGFKSTASAWLDYDRPQDAESIFVIDAALDEAEPDADRMALALTKAWTPRAAAESLRPLVAELIRLGLRHRDSPREERQEEISEQIYVMY